MEHPHFVGDGEKEVVVWEVRGKSQERAGTYRAVEGRKNYKNSWEISMKDSSRVKEKR